MVNVALESLSVEEKLQLMESVWDSLFSAPDTIASPNWHGDVLKKREQDIKDGTDRFEAWEIAKESLRNQLK